MNPVTLTAAWAVPPSAVPRAADPVADASWADGESAGWLLQRRCSLTPAQFGACFVALALVSTLVAAFFWAMGARFVTLFAGIEVLLVGLAFAWHALHAADRDHLRVHEGHLLVERRRGLSVRREQWPLVGLRVRLAGDGSIELGRCGRRSRVGRDVDGAQCRRVLADLRRAVSTSTG